MTIFRLKLRDQDNEEMYFTGEDDSDDDSEIENDPADNQETSDLFRSLILALNTCYHVGLQNEETRTKYLDCVAPIFKAKNITGKFMAKEINLCYEVILDEFQLPNAIARNQVTAFAI